MNNKQSNWIPDSGLVNTIRDLDLNQLYWIHGLISGIIEERKPGISPSNENKNNHSGGSTSEKSDIKILYATHSGNSRKIANQLQSEASKKGIEIEIIDIAEYKPNQILKEKTLLFISSTQGEGEPPLAAEEFCEYIHSSKLSSLKHLKFSVLALGDKSYVHYCKTGKDIHNRMVELGASDLLPVKECDVEYQSTANEWIEQILTKLENEKLISVVTGSKIEKNTATKNNQDVFTRSNPGILRVTDVINLNGRGSDKLTAHVELMDDSASINYLPGDALGLYFQNPPELVKEITHALKINEDNLITTSDRQEVTISDYLLNHAELSLLTRELIEKYNNLQARKDFEPILKDNSLLQKFIYENDLLQLITDYPIKLNAEELYNLTGKMQPRLYSIASSLNSNENEVHLTIGKLNYKFRDRQKLGACSSYVSGRMKIDHNLRSYIHTNENFRLPDDHSDIIMIGPGTGIAPFRSFLQEREFRGAKGKNWLFFGDQHFTTDFLYQIEWQRWQKKDLLTRLDVAFSRDQQEKLYVQHLMIQQSKQIFDWLENGAHIYICGNKDRMAKDVNHALLAIIKNTAGLTNEKANEYFKNLKRTHRYHEDVY